MPDIYIPVKGVRVLKIHIPQSAVPIPYSTVVGSASVPTAERRAQSPALLELYPHSDFPIPHSNVYGNNIVEPVVLRASRS